MTLADIPLLVYFCSTFAVQAAIHRWPDQEQLIMMAFYIYSTFHWGGLAVIVFARHTFAGGLFGGIDIVLSAGSLWAAQQCWDRWSRRRRKRQRGASKVAVRLGRLVIIPAG